jgi:hypothetical protein
MQRAEPRHVPEPDARGDPKRIRAILQHLRKLHAVVLQVEFERQTLKPVFSLDRL